ncbi:MAG: polysaccharide biosynthesis C-terminal domain-containing protein [Saprospiraceae bacterium]|nr:polysaccharide biosynthesis C-terminal domain-containing protein [Saprospiraceae bacterium]
MGIIKRQSILYTIISYFGLAIGAVNTLLLMPHYLTQAQVGLIGVFTAIAFPLGAISNLGSIFAINRFLPYYKKFLPADKIDLPILAVSFSLIGFLVVTLIMISGKTSIFQWFAHAPLLTEYFYLLPFFTMGYMLNSIFQAINNGYFFTVWVGIVTEVIFRVFNVLIILLLVFGMIGFDGYIHLYVFMFWIGLVLYIAKLKSSSDWNFFNKISLVTKRLKQYIVPYSSFFWFTSVFSVLATMIDTIVLAGVNGLEKSGSLLIATYFITVTQIPQRSIVSVSVPVISESWRNNDMKNLQDVYFKSANNMLWAGGFIYLCILLNINEILSFLPASYHEIKWVVYILGFAKLIDYATGVNQNILALSRKNWKLDFYTNILLVVLLIPLNYFLIKKMGIIGAATANVIGFFIYNFVRTFYLYQALKLSPFNRQNLRLIVVIVLILVSLVLYGMYTEIGEFNFWANSLIMTVKSLLFGLGYLFVLYLTRASDDLKHMLMSNTIFKKIYSRF